jgi:hypothetical protein
MYVKIDGVENTQIQTDDQTIGDIVMQARNVLDGSGRMIVGITCNGETITPEKINEIMSDSISNYQEVEFQTAFPIDLAKNSLYACREFLKDITDTLHQSIDKLHQSQIQEAMSLLGPMFGKLNDTYRGVMGTFQLMNIDPESIELANGNAKKFMNDLVRKLQEIKQSLENQDYVQLTDLFEYELLPVVTEWQKMIDNVSEFLFKE